MPLYLKKVDAVQFKLTDEEKTKIAKRDAVFFEGSPVRHTGGDQYLAILQQGENLVKIYHEQWLIRHPDGLWQVLWPDQFNRHFTKGDHAESFKVGYDPFAKPKIIQRTI